MILHKDTTSQIGKDNSLLAEIKNKPKDIPSFGNLAHTQNKLKELCFKKQKMIQSMLQEIL
jgi:hypothetical protein